MLDPICSMSPRIRILRMLKTLSRGGWFGLEAVMRRRGVLDAQASGSARQGRPRADLGPRRGRPTAVSQKRPSLLAAAF